MLTEITADWKTCLICMRKELMLNLLVCIVWDVLRRRGGNGMI